ncbi:hypothetical protein [Microbispora sp. NPDC049125]|uniref:hypothetical protein n=1 Tax=Microbispora sp. NPDC049125 TaxID=3154929 RepID=UPI0034665C45
MSMKPAALAALSLVVLAVCGRAAETRAAPAPGGGPEPTRAIETARADCMRQRGFTYIPYVPPARVVTEEESRRDRGEHAALRAFRARYGYGAYALYVYPQRFGNPMVKPARPGPVDPNLSIQSALSPTQLTAYRTADDACYAQAVKKILGRDVASAMDHFRQAEDLAQRRTVQLDADPTLARLAGAMAGCMRAKGYAIGSSTPSAMDQRGPARFQAQITEMGRADDISDDPLKAQGPGADGRYQVYQPMLSPEQARPYLTAEIADALDDLECGADFYRVYTPRVIELRGRAYAEFGLEP